ncbi:MAG TPA: GEVED domain-containing protein, partial [Prosthecobacter sp.]
TLYTIDLGSASLVGTPVVTKYSSTGSNTTGNFGDIVWDPLTDKIYGYNTNDSANLGLFEINPTTGMCTRVAASFLSTFGSLVIDANGLAYGYGSQSSSTAQDTLYVFNRTNGVLNGTMTTVGSGPVVTNSDGAACPGAPPSMKLGNLVWNDANDNGLKDTNEQGIDGVALRLFLGGENPLTATPAATVTTSGGGLYAFDNLSPGQYFIYIPTPPAAFPLSSYITDTADNSQDNDDNGTQTTQGQPVRSPLISLVAGTEATTDGDGDSNTDLTVDFGFRACPVLAFGGANAPAATVGVPYSHTFTTGNGSGLYTWSLASGTLPAGLSMSTAGVVSGTPTISNGAGVSVTVRVTDSLGCQATSAVTLVVLPNMDFGDYAPFPSASSIASVNLRIGATVDTEASATTNATAVGDDQTGTDDEDGVTLPVTVEQGTANSLSVTVTNNSGAAAYLNVWMDFNRNGGLGDAGELIATNVLIANGTANAVRTVNFNVPATASVGASAVRVRLTSVTTPGPDGADGTGEVEDHAISIIPPTRDYGDFVGFANASQVVTPSLKLGAQVEAEGTPVTNADGTGDDITGIDDEDAVTFPAMTAGQPVTLTVPATNQTGSPAYVNAWIDFNNDGVLQSEEQIVSQLLVPAGSSNVPLSLDFTVPTDAVTAATFVGARFRFSEEPAPGPTGAGGDGEVEDYAVVILAPITDFGDWDRGPSVSNTADSRLRLGSSVDAEYAATTNATATGDDLTGVDDEDGVTFSALTAGAPATVQVTRTNTTGAAGYLNGWIDFNNNGSFGDAGEQILSNSAVANGTSSSILTTNITVPANAVTGTPLGARFRITSLLNPGTGGAGGTGEVEDYVVTVAEPTTDFGDHQGLGSASSLRDPALRLGAAIDTEYVATLNALATGDDTTGADDEDGVTLPAMTAGAPVTIPVVVTNQTGATAYLNAWVDFNGNGLLTDAGEQIATNVNVPAGAANSTVNLNITVPATSLTGVNLAARFRLVNVPGAASTGAAGNGEVEDYVAMVSAPTTDFGDYSNFGDASQGVSPALRMGASVDAEYASTRNATATGDDLTGADDEDGVTIPALTAGAPATISINVSNSSGALGYINAWIDFNNNGVLTDAGEQVASNLNVVTGTNNGTVTLNVNVPAGAVTGTLLGARFRLSAPLSPGPVGSNPAVGEVEDYVVTIAAPTTDFGDYSGFSPASSTVDTSLRLGALTDAEYAQTANASASGDDTTGIDDEDSLVVPSLSAGGSFTLPVSVTNTRGSSAFLNVWIDYNNNGVLTDSGEQVASNVVVANGTSNGTVNVSGTIPASAVTGTNIGLRIRLTSVSSPGTIGLAGNGEVEDYIVNISAPTRDYGDWSGAGDVSNGVSNNLRLGATVDAEAASTRNATATGDDITGIDDEDGVALPSMTAGQSVTIPVTVTNTTGAGAFLNAWIDFNNNGVFTDQGEQIASNNGVTNNSNGTVVSLSVNVPATAVTGSNLGARFRLTSVSNPGALGDGAGVGEVEDYVVNVGVPTTDFGDFSGFSPAASTQTPALRLGALTDTEYAQTANLTATGDDITGTDDEDGVALPTLVAGAPASVPVTVTNTTGTTAYLNAWIDYNNNGVTTDAGEQIASNVAVANGVADFVQNVNFTVPAAATTGLPLGVRFRLTNVQNPGPAGTAGLGEVEDYVTTIDVPPSDYGDWNRGESAFSRLRAGLRLGSLVDTEYAPLLNATATGDDTTGVDDEDGVALPDFVAGGPATIPVTVTNTTGATAYLNVWMDFNNNESFDDPGEQLAENVLMVTGQTNVLRNISVVVPPNAVTGATIGLRFRLTDVSTPGSTGGAGQGEVEDYTTTVAVPTTDFGDWDGAADASSVASSDLRLGALADTEYAPTRNAAATGDDATGSDDEDGVTTPSSLSLGSSGALVATVTNNFGSSAYVNAWVDFNGNGSFADGGEQVATNVIFSNGSNGVTRSLGFTTPSNAKPGLRGVRVRLTSVQNPGPVGAAGTGEVEDYLVQINCPVISLSPGSLTVPVVGKPYNVTFNSNGGTGPYTFAVTSGSLPAGLTLSSSGALTGAATTTTPVTLTVTSTDANGCSTSLTYSVTPVCPAIPISPSSLQTPTIGSAYSQTITASGGTAPYTFTVESGSLPTGLSLGLNNGVVSGTPSQAGAFNFVLKVTDFYGCSATQNYSLTPSCPSVSVTPSSLPSPVVGTAYNQTLTPAGGVGPYTLSVSSGSLPAGLTLSSSGLISGTPASSNSAMFVVRAVDSRGCAGTRAYSLTPTCPALSVQTTALNNGYLGTPYSASLAATGGAAPYSWSVSSGALPPGVTLSSAGTLSGTPTVLGTFTFTARAADSNGCAATRSLTVTVKGMGIGNRVWLDSNNNGIQDAGENGVAGVVVELFTPGADNAIGGSGSGADSQVGAAFTTGADGLYLFGNLAPGSYYVRATPPAAFTHSSGTPATTDNNADGNNDGAQPGGVGTPLFSPVIALSPGTEATNDGDGDADTNLTVDFGLWAPLAVGNVVFIDVNRDGRMNANEGVGYAFIQLFRAGQNPGTDTPVNAAMTDSKGRYLIMDIDPGSYFLHLPAIQFEDGGVLRFATPITSVSVSDDNVGQDLLPSPNPVINGASTAVFTLLPGQLAAGTAESGVDGMSDDDGIDSNTDLTFDLGLECLDCSAIASPAP